jgi:hypothetical protein
MNGMFLLYVQFVLTNLHWRYQQWQCFIHTIHLPNRDYRAQLYSAYAPKSGWHYPRKWCFWPRRSWLSLPTKVVLLTIFDHLVSDDRDSLIVTCDRDYSFVITTKYVDFVTHPDDMWPNVVLCYQFDNGGLLIIIIIHRGALRNDFDT